MSLKYFSLGIGASCCYTASSQILAIYFDKLKYLAFSLATLGIYIGLMTWPILCQFLLNKFGYSHAMGIMACAHLLHIIAGISFFEPAEKGLEGKAINYCLKYPFFIEQQNRAKRYFVKLKNFLIYICQRQYHSYFHLLLLTHSI